MLISCCCLAAKLCPTLFRPPWTAACQASLPFTISQSLLKLMSIELVMPSNYLILCHPLLLLPTKFLSIRIFSNFYCTAKWIRYSYTYILFNGFPSHLGHCRALNRAPCAIQNVLIVIYFIRGVNSVYMSVPISQFIPLSPPPPWIHKFVLYICVSLLSK